MKLRWFTFLNHRVCVFRSVMKFSVVILVSKVMAMAMMMTMMMMSIMTSSIHTMASQPLLIYCPICSPNGTRLCAVEGQQTETFEGEKLTSCALNAMTSNAVVFSYRDSPTGSGCKVFQSSPSSYEQIENCVGYQVILYCSILTLNKIVSISIV